MVVHAPHEFKICDTAENFRCKWAYSERNALALQLSKMEDWLWRKTLTEFKTSKEGFPKEFMEAPVEEDAIAHEEEMRQLLLEMEKLGIPGAGYITNHTERFGILTCMVPVVDYFDLLLPYYLHVHESNCRTNELDEPEQNAALETEQQNSNSNSVTEHRRIPSAAAAALEAVEGEIVEVTEWFAAAVGIFKRSPVHSFGLHDDAQEEPKEGASQNLPQEQHLQGEEEQQQGTNAVAREFSLELLHPKAEEPQPESSLSVGEGLAVRKGTENIIRADDNEEATPQQQQNEQQEQQQHHHLHGEPVSAASGTAKGVDGAEAGDKLNNEDDDNEFEDAAAAFLSCSSSVSERYIDADGHVSSGEEDDVSEVQSRSEVEENGPELSDMGTSVEGAAATDLVTATAGRGLPGAATPAAGAPFKPTIAQVHAGDPALAGELSSPPYSALAASESSEAELSMEGMARISPAAADAAALIPGEKFYEDTAHVAAAPADASAPTDDSSAPADASAPAGDSASRDEAAAPADSPTPPATPSPALALSAPLHSDSSSMDAVTIPVPCHPDATCSSLPSVGVDVRTSSKGDSISQSDASVLVAGDGDASSASIRLSPPTSSAAPSAATPASVDVNSGDAAALARHHRPQSSLQNDENGYDEKAASQAECSGSVRKEDGANAKIAGSVQENGAGELIQEGGWEAAEQQQGDNSSSGSHGHTKMEADSQNTRGSTRVGNIAGSIPYPFVALELENGSENRRGEDAAGGKNCEGDGGGGGEGEASGPKEWTETQPQPQLEDKPQRIEETATGASDKQGRILHPEDAVEDDDDADIDELLMAIGEILERTGQLDDLLSLPPPV